ncbi:hypothetical protein GCM10010464_02520 [Pseudonocardia yunnanensis]
MTPASTAAATALSVWVDSVPQTMNATTSAAATPKTHQSIGWRCSAEPPGEAVAAGVGSLPPGVSLLLGVSETVMVCGPDAAEPPPHVRMKRMYGRRSRMGHTASAEVAPST